ncbi:PAC2 family protein [Acidiferrimicrobium sp. IK]|uniref:PAC2 family protein n=1 Tax=Acidiferrimicrobium sp. IK TaxID=2871700 RepID=UPI0021CB26FB|nr:PAC2 family protein [Acidiferrimicrobium sp. IK]MCU4187332.1 PAC2 family protein [Acidiferrimicrobium sp. IK]
MSELATIHSLPALEDPVLVMALEGWIDAGAAAVTAATALLETLPRQLLATFDGDALIDHRARRPVLRIVNGVHSGLHWPEIRIEAATTRTGRSVLLLVGPEPDMRWHQFTTEVVSLAQRFGVKQVIGLGAFPAPVPHTRPVRLTATATSAELAAEVGFLPVTIDVPAGAQAALEHAFGDAGLPAVGLWARVPHYASAMPYPAAAAALLDELARLAHLELDTSALREAGQTTFDQIEQLVAASDEHAAMIRQLETQHDAEAEAPPASFGPLPSGDELAAELERFLRGQG